MSTDLQVIEVRDVLPIYDVRIVPDLVPRTLDVTGRDFRSVHEVLINDEKSPDVIIVSSRQMLAQVPDSQQRTAIRSVMAISNRLTGTQSSKLTFRMGDTTHGVAGIERVLQTFLKLLMQTPGTDIFAKNVGGGLLRSIGRQTDSTGKSMTADLSVAVSRATSQMMSLQSNDQTIPLSERLLYTKIIEAAFIPSETALVARILVAVQSGELAAVGVRA